MTSNSKAGINKFWPGEPIVVKCSVKGLVLHWHIGRTSFVFIWKADVTYSAGAYEEGFQSYMNATYGRLDFYQNESYVVSTTANSSVNYELHMHLINANNFIKVVCKDLYQKNKTIASLFFSMLNLA